MQKQSILTESTSVVAWVLVYVGGLTAKGHKRNFRGDRNVLYLPCGGPRGLLNGQGSLSTHIKWMRFFCV